MRCRPLWRRTTITSTPAGWSAGRVVEKHITDSQCLAHQGSRFPVQQAHRYYSDAPAGKGGGGGAKKKIVVGAGRRNILAGDCASPRTSPCCATVFLRQAVHMASKATAGTTWCIGCCSAAGFRPRDTPPASAS